MDSCTTEVLLVAKRRGYPCHLSPAGRENLLLINPELLYSGLKFLTIR
jgi:hypothetical protein